MKKVTFIIALLLTAFSSFAQSNGQITGKIKDSRNQAALEAVVTLLNSTDSSIVKNTVNDKEGNFKFDNLNPGNYILVATAMGHSKVYSTPLALDADHATIQAGTLELEPVDKELTAVVVNSKKQFIERKIDKTVLNPEALISNTGTTAMEVLEKAPGVSVDKDGNISLKGKQGVIVMLDGKPTYMSSADLANYLNTLPSSSIDQIEIMTNPSAKYDASGNSGIINIKTKKNKQKGFNGSLATAYGQGSYPKTNNSVNLNYRIGKVNIFSNLGANYRVNRNYLDINRIYGNEDKSVRAVFDQNTSKINHNQGYNGKLGMDFYATKKTTYGIVLSGYMAPGKEDGISTSFLKSPAGIVDSIVVADWHEKNKYRNGGINLNLRHSFDSTGKEITADVDFIQYKSNKDQNFVNAVLNPDQSNKYSDRLIGELPSDIKIYSAKVDYQQTLKKGLKLETGVKISYVTTDNGANYFNMINGQKMVDFKKTNHFEYKENINAGYVNFNKSIKKWGFQIGLRAENTNYEGLQSGNPTKPDSAFKRSYTSVFPTSYVSYAMNDKNQFGFSAGRRINRPDYEDLNPFLFFMDKYTYEEGNPFLRPMYSNVFELSHTYKQFLTTTLNYSHTTDLFNESFRQSKQPDDSISTIVSRANYGVVNNLGLSVNAQLKVSKVYTVMLYGEARYQEYKAVLNGDKLHVAASNFVANVNNQFTFKKGWGAELSGFYRTKTTEGQMTIGAISQVDAAVKKDIIKGKGSLRLSARDMFGPMKIKGNMDFQSTEVHFRQQRDSRVITLGFNYRFGKPIKGLKNRKTGGAGDEQNRIKSA